MSALKINQNLISSYIILHSTYLVINNLIRFSFCNLVPALGQEDPLKNRMATHSSILARRIPMDRGAWWATV